MCVCVRVCVRACIKQPCRQLGKIRHQDNDHAWGQGSGGVRVQVGSGFRWVSGFRWGQGKASTAGVRVQVYYLHLVTPATPVVMRVTLT